VYTLCIQSKDLSVCKTYTLLMAREKTVRVNEDELQSLKEYRDTKYSGYVPLGFVIGDLTSSE